MATTNTGGYPGRQLDQEDSFRIIEIQPGEHDSAVTVRLIPTNLQDGPSYEALSYAWGDLAETEPIQVVAASLDGSGDSPSAPLSVTTNCADALRRLRSRTEPRTLWVDSICINQALIPERNQQLRLMSRIYSEASGVVVYLGERSSDGGSDAVMDWLHEVHEPSDSSSGHLPAPDLDMIWDFLGRRWFTRVWVLQEVRLARKTTVVCGDREVNWNAFEELTYWERNQWGQYSRRRYSRLPYAVKSLLANGTECSNNLMPSCHVHLLQLLADTRDLGATDAKDKLFAILPLLAWERKRERDNHPAADASGYIQEEFMIPGCDYGRPPTKIFKSLARDLINAVGLHVLYCAESPMSVLGLPSWAPDWSACNPTTFNGKPKFRGLYLTDLSSESNTNKDIPKTWHFSEYPILDGKHGTQLHVDTTMEDRIMDVGDMCDIYANHFPLEQWEGLCDPEHLKVSMVIGQYPNSRFTIVLFKDLIEYSHVAMEQVEMIKKYNLAKSEDSSPKPIASSLVEHSNCTKQTALMDLFKGWLPGYQVHAERLFQACHGRRFFVTDTGRLGLAPEGARVGDQIMGIKGLDYPFVVRPVLASGDGPEAVRLLGTCYVEEEQELLRGEADPDRPIRYEERVIR